MRIVAQMLVRNEVDVIEETLSELVRQGLTEIVILDGGSDDGTVDRIAGYLKADIHLCSSPDPGGRFADHLRNELLQMTLRHDPDWIVSVDADEIWDQATRPKTAIELAEASGANVVRAWVPQFWITVADVREGILVEDTSRSVQDRRRWYSWGHMGTFIWKVHPDHFYPRDTPKRTPELPGLTWREWQVAGPMMPICKHYCFRSLDQAMKRARERRERGGRRYFGKYYENWIIDEVACGLARKDGREWVTANNHQAVHEYMARAKRRE